MGIINIVQNVKEIHYKYIVLVKVGNFYYCYGRDSYIISYIFNYKINILNHNMYTCSFPQNALNKVINVLEEKKINYIILDRRNNYEIIEKSDNKNLNQYDEFYEIGKKKNVSKMRIEKIYAYLLENREDKQLIEGIEKLINERRKV